MIVASAEALLTVFAMAVVLEVAVVAVVAEAVLPHIKEVTLAGKQEVVKVVVVVVQVVDLLEAVGDGAVKVAHLANAGQDLDHLPQFLMLLLTAVPA